MRPPKEDVGGLDRKRGLKSKRVPMNVDIAAEANGVAVAAQPTPASEGKAFALPPANEQRW